MTPETLLGGVLLAAFAFYALGGGADFGAGVWDALAVGRTGPRQREVIAHAMGPIWEANHVWLVLAVVLLFVGFPIAFAAIATALHVPLTIALVGIVLRGAAFTFRTYDRPDRRVQRTWSRVFAAASIVTPVMLGVCVGATLTGRLRVDVARGGLPNDFVGPWLAPFPFALGLFVLESFAFLAATYLTLESRDPELRRAFRARAIGAALASGALAWACLLLAAREAPRMHEGLLDGGRALAFQCVTGAVALVAIVALVRERYLLARTAAALQIVLIVAGWGLAQYPVLIEPDVTLWNAAAPRTVLRPMLAALGLGALVLFPALFWLYRVFKSRPSDDAATGDHGGGLDERGAPTPRH
jgi:cytochrome d ubiquinol oxidase subunit II